ncbi:MAG: hypothetical protein EPN73_01770 [Paraburkholderia sp.]|nr:MAG: hypothetical protein EPN73_01770 [Paraburkholderia sp.]
MGPKTPVTDGDFFQQPLRDQINLKHPLVRLVELINRGPLGETMKESVVPCKGRPARSPHLIAGLLYLQHDGNREISRLAWPSGIGQARIGKVRSRSR